MPDVRALGNRIRSLREARHWSQEDLAKESGVGRPWIKKVEEFGIKQPGADKVIRVANALDANVDEFLRLAGAHVIRVPERPDVAGDAREELRRVREQLERLGSVIEQRTAEYPVLGSVPAGYPTTEEQQVIDRVVIPSGALWIRVNGDSMVGLGIESGDFIIVDPNNKEPRRGQVTVVRLRTTNEVTVKRLFREDDHVRLEPANHQYRAIIATDVEVLGVVIGVHRRL